MKKCKLTILDQVNVKFSDLEPACRRDIVEELKFMVPYARHMPQFKLGRWDGKIAFATVGGSTYFNVLDRVFPIIMRHGYALEAMEIDDQRTHAQFDFQPIESDFLSDTVWPAGHPKEGEAIELRDHQVDSINRYLENPQSIQAISTSAGKAQPLYSRILTPTGWKSMGEIKVGDDIIASDGSVSLVTGVFPQGIKKIYRIHFSDGRFADACPEHLWEVHKHEWKKAKTHSNSSWDIISTVKLKSLLSKKANKNRISIPLFIPDWGSPDTDLPIDPYVLGCLIGDGSMRHSSILFSSADEQVIAMLNDRLGEEYCLYHISRFDYRIGFVDYLSERSKHGRNNNGNWHYYLKMLKKLGLHGKYSYEKFVPSEYLKASPSQKLELLRGLMDTDGTVGRHGETSFSTTSLLLAENVRDIVRSLGGWATISTKKTSYTHNGIKKSGRASFTVRIRYQRPSDLFHLERKKIKTKAQHRFKLRLGIARIEEIGEYNSQCIMIDHPDHLYVTDNYVVTHNTVITGCLSKIVEPYGRSLVIVPGKDLVRQTCEDYLNIGLDTGRYYGDHKEPDHKHTIATWQSVTALQKNNPQVLEQILKDCVSVIVDEAHTIKGKELKDFLCDAAAHVPLRWGLTGTIPKEDFEYLSLLCSIGPKVGEVRAAELQEKGILSNCKIHIQQLKDDVQYPSFAAERDYLATDYIRVKYLAEHCRQIAESGNTLVLVSSIELGKSMSEILDVPFIYGAVKSEKRGEEYKSINYTDNQLLIASFGVASTGINIPRIFNLVLIEPGKSFVRVIQSIGRGLRTAKDKDFVNIYDVCSTAKYSKRHLTKRKEFYNEAEYPFVITKINYREK